MDKKNPVTVDIITTKGEHAVLNNLKRKAESANKMFAELIRYMDDAQKVELKTDHIKRVEVPKWL